MLVDHACNNDNSNSKVMNCLKDLVEVTPIENPTRCKCFGHISFIHSRDRAGSNFTTCIIIF